MKASLKLEYSLRVLAQLARRNKGNAVTRMRTWRAADGSAGGFRVRATDGFRSFREYVAQFD